MKYENFLGIMNDNDDEHDFHDIGDRQQVRHTVAPNKRIIFNDGTQCSPSFLVVQEWF